jgi:cytoskeletal protein CcmA (bactofilin family)
VASERVEIHNGGSLIGEVSADRVSIEDGAYLQGRIDMRRPDPKAPPEFNRNTSAEQKASAVD